MNVEVLTSIGMELGSGLLHIPGAAKATRIEDGDFESRDQNRLESLAAAVSYP